MHFRQNSTELKRAALIIAISDYKHIAKLPNPIRDAEAVSAALVDLGFEVKCCLDGTQETIERKFTEFLSSLPDDGEILLYFACHGLQVSGNNFILPQDVNFFNPKDLDKLINVQDMISDVEAKSSRALVFLDACRDDGGLSRKVVDLLEGRGGQEQGATAAQVWAAPTRFRGNTSSQHGLALQAIGSNTFICFSAAPGAKAIDAMQGEPLSPYAAAVIRHIRTRGLELFDFAQRVAKTVHKSTERRQISWFHSNLQDRFFFNPPTWRPVVSLMLRGFLAGFIATLFKVWGDGHYYTIGDRWFLAFNGVWLGSVLAYGDLKWGGRRWWTASIVLLCFMALTWYATVISDPHIMTYIEAKERLTWENVLNSSKTQAFLLSLLLVGALTGFAAVFSCATVSPAFRDFAPFAMTLVAGSIVFVLTPVFYILYHLGLLTKYDLVADLFGAVVGGVWHAAMAGVVGRAYMRHVPNFR